VKKKAAAETPEQTQSSAPGEFEYQGVKVVFDRATVGSSIEARRLIRKLLNAYGYLSGGAIPDSDFDNMDEYCAAMSRTTTDAAWHAHSNMEDDEIRRRFELFLSQDEGLYLAFRRASAAVMAAAQQSAAPLLPGD
jgi:hypothetical protein